MRRFLALKIPDIQKKSIDRQIGQLKKEYPSFLWTPYSEYHLTVHFFGEEEHETEIIKKTTDALYQQKTFYLYGVGLNMLVHNKITFYVEIKKEKALIQLVETVRNIFPNISGYKVFVPHISVGRSKIPSKLQYFLLHIKLKKTNIDIEFKVDQVTLFKSIDQRNNVYYEEIGSIPFPSDK